MPPRIPRVARLVAVLVCAVAAASSAEADLGRELGRPFMRGYPPGEHLRAATTQTLTQDEAGWIYFANNVDLLVHDGARWNSVPLTGESGGIRQFATAPDGTIYAGGAAVLGFLRGAGMATGFVSLADRLPGGAGGVGEIRFVAAGGDTVAFANDDGILVWRGGRFTAIPCAAPRGQRGARLHPVGGDILVSAPGWPLQRLQGGALVPVADDAVLRENQVVAVTADGAEGGFVLLTAERGFFRIDRTGRVAALDNGMNRLLAGRRVHRGRRLADGSWAVAFSAVSGGGGLLLLGDGRRSVPLGQEAGLYSDDVRDLVPDREGGLWVTLDAGAARLEWPSPVTLFDEFNGLGHGAVRALARHGGVLHAETDEGMFRLRPAGEDGVGARFERAAGAPDAALRTKLAASRERPARRDARWPAYVRRHLGEPICEFDEMTPDGPVRWVGCAEGLLRWETGGTFAPAPPLMLELEATGVAAGGELPSEHGPVTLRYLAIRQQRTNAVEYQTRLTGREREWSGWGAGRERHFAFLPAGRYTFEVRARDSEGVVSPVQSLAFAVRAPWWLTPWALAGWAGAIGGLMLAAVRLRTHALERRAAALEGVVEARTAELAEKNRELTRLHRLEFDEKVAARLAEEKARLEMLRYQLNPHFLFNTLTSISASLPAGAAAARGMVERLAEFCRLTLHRSGDREWTTLRDEMRLIGNYLKIEQARWGDLLDVDILHDPVLDDVRMPHFLLLPIVENALKYGRATSPERVGLRLATGPSGGGGLVVEIANTGQWVEPSNRPQVATLGIGLENLRERLSRHYPRCHRLEINHADGWVTVRLALLAPPLHL